MRDFFVFTVVSLIKIYWCYHEFFSARDAAGLALFLRLFQAEKKAGAKRSP
jgi:hypothetical protein